MMIDIIRYNFRSVLTFFGVNEVFENAIRAALCARFVFLCDSIPFAWAQGLGWVDDSMKNHEI